MASPLAAALPPLARGAGVRGLLVGVMNVRRGEEAYEALAVPLRACGVGVYAVNSREVRASPQGGSWFHVLPLLRTGARLHLSDSDLVWLRDPRPYLRQLERLHPRLDFTVSSDQQHATDGKPLRRFRRRRGRRFGGEAEANDLDVEAHRACWQSRNIGVMHFPPGARAGAIAAIEQAVAHLSEENNLRRVDQGPINFRKKVGAGKWRWARQLHAVDKPLCGLVNGTVVGAVLPSTAPPGGVPTSGSSSEERPSLNASSQQKPSSAAPLLASLEEMLMGGVPAFGASYLIPITVNQGITPAPEEKAAVPPPPPPRTCYPCLRLLLGRSAVHAFPTCRQCST
ncbi:hypothetical protein AB1Y20_021130 [Prymnesium parvum]|uniref:Nucleotide-diphospho-sugar transferase domain-containing protein n=1 Tax=Prymnesium parvum TaxID=97485 RepID=A0AB34JKG7_PRYPA